MSSKTDAVVKLAIVFFISLLSFSIGTFVGKKYSDNQHQLAALEPQKHGAATEHRNVASAAGEEHKPGAMTDEDIAKLAEEFVADETTAPQHDSAEKNDETQHHSEVIENKAVAASQHHDSAEPSTAAKNIVAGKSPAPENSERHGTAARDERIPSSLPKDVAQFAVGKFTIQVAAYAEEAEAQKMASNLKNKGYSAFYFPANVRGKTWYRVSVGQFATQKEAQTYKNEFMNKSKMDHAIVQKISE